MRSRKRRGYFERMLWKIHNPWAWLRVLAMDELRKKREFDEMREAAAIDFLKHRNPAEDAWRAAEIQKHREYYRKTPPKRNTFFGI